MTFRHSCRLMAAALAAVLALSTPAMAWSDEIITGTADLEPEIQAEGREDFDSELLIGSSGVSETTSDQIIAAHQKALAYIRSTLTDPRVDTIGGEWSVIALARNNMLAPDVQDRYIKNVLDTLEKTHGILSKAKYTEFSRVILGLTSIGMNPGAIGGFDLLQPMAEFRKIPIQGINGPIFALIAMDCHDYEIPALSETQKGEQTTRELLISYILEHQLASGAWGLSETLDVPDDMTPMAIQALAPYYHQRGDVQAAVDRAIEIWSGRQSDNGDFVTGEGIEVGSETVSQTIIAFSALDPDLLRDPRFVKNGNSLLDALLSYQTESGAFAHVPGGAEDAMSTDQATLALTAYVRTLNGQTSLFDMTDVPLLGENDEPEENVKAFLAELRSLPAKPTLRHKDSVFGLLAKLGQMGDFSEKQAAEEILASMKEDLNLQQAQVDRLDKAIWDGINPSRITLEDRPVVEDLRAQYNAMHRDNRAFLPHAEDLFFAEAALLDLENGSLVLRGEQPGEKPKPPVPQPGQKPGLTTVVESNTVTARVNGGTVAAAEFEQVRGQERNLRIEGTLPDGRTYSMTVFGKDIAAAADMRIGIRAESAYAEEIGLLAKDTFALFCFEQTGKFPGAMLVELPVDLEDGQYLLLSYNATAGKAEFCQKVMVENGTAVFVADQGGDFFLTRKVSSRSVDEIRAELEAQTAPTEAPTEQTVPETTAAAEPEEMPAGKSVSVWVIAAVIVIAAAAAAAGIIFRKRKDQVK